MDRIISTPDSMVKPSSNRRQLAILAALCTFLFLGTLQLYTQHNSFPYYCHADEHKKVKQLLTRDFNFNHPQLLLVATDMVRRIRNQVDGYQEVTMSGRWVSATFAATSVVLLTLMGWTAYGLTGAWCVGLLVAICPVIGVTAHFLKEDTAMLLGLSATGLALVHWRRYPCRRRLLWLGLACGLMASSKYIATLALLPVIAVVLGNREQSIGLSRLSTLAYVLVPCALVFFIINFPIVFQSDRFTLGLTKGATLVAHGRKRPADLPNLEVFEDMEVLSRPVMLMAGITFLLLMTKLPRERFVGLSILGIGLLFTVILTITPLGIPTRYLLIPAVSLHALAGLGIAMLVEILSRNREPRQRHGIAATGAALAIALAWIAYPNYHALAIDDFDRADARAELIRWVNSTLGPDAVLAVSPATRLPGVGNIELADPAIQFSRVPVTIWKLDKVSAWQLREEGITHLVLREGQWSQFRSRTKTESANYESLTGSPDAIPKTVWRTPRQIRKKNRWLGEELVVVQL